MLRNRIGYKGVCLAVALIAPLQLVAASAGDEPDTAPQVVERARVRPTPRPTNVATRIRGTEAAAPAPAPAFATLPVPAAVPELVTEPDAAVRPTAQALPSPPPPRARAHTQANTFAERFPAQAAAAQDPAQPATTRWALLIGINEHRGTVADNIGSRQDAEDFRAHLLANGWLDDHILLLTDRNAVRANIVDGIGWLAERTDQDSVAVFHYSGHSKKWSADVDGDGERTDEGLWPNDDRYISDAELVRLLDPVRPHALWISFATCNAAGMADPGLVQPGRILTFSSGEPQKSYEHPGWSNSVWGWFMIEQAFAAGVGDTDGDGRVTVEEAFAWARPRARETTAGQRYGAQDGVMVDQVPGEFDLLVPGQPRPAREAPSEPNPSSPDQGQPAPAPDGGGGGEASPPPPPREPREDDRRKGICLLCRDD